MVGLWVLCVVGSIAHCILIAYMRVPLQTSSTWSGQRLAGHYVCDTQRPSCACRHTLQSVRHSELEQVPRPGPDACKGRVGMELTEVIQSNLRIKLTDDMLAGRSPLVNRGRSRQRPPIGSMCAAFCEPQAACWCLSPVPAPPPGHLFPPQRDR